MSAEPTILDPAQLTAGGEEAVQHVRVLARSDAGLAARVAAHHSARLLAGRLDGGDGGVAGWYAHAGTVAATPVPGGRRLLGDAPVSAGGADAHRVVLAAGGRVQAVVDVEDPGVTVVPGDPGFGLRSAPPGRISLRDVTAPIPAAVPVPTAWRLFDETLQVAVAVGIIEGFLTAARDFVVDHARPWHESGAERAARDPHTIGTFGDAHARSRALALLFGDAADGFRRRPVTLARWYAHRHVGPIITAVIGVVGASGTSERYGLDRYWRDARTHALRHPPHWTLSDAIRTDATGARHDG
ncbi:hypothetical protein GCM10010399_10040 [Dactylosporangium fulvum]|uniref:Acyl-CoA dehydrogenase family protein n=1 Tax=Dactylosporangium fulvum TaxID=53359 RepID=A0ABY5W9S8_9ACTN|nr:acyl-CoA dehydrogenase family protein [Dactylosporangium fulvum]UWP86828.1 acyl-CoA dehydrogenase family protein [Dactylosporangium fulvum]